MCEFKANEILFFGLWRKQVMICLDHVTSSSLSVETMFVYRVGEPLVK